MRHGLPCSRGSGLPSHVRTSSTSASIARARGTLDRIRHVRARHEVVAGAHHELGFGLRNGVLGDGGEWHAGPAIVEPAPGRHAVEVADILDLTHRQKLFPVQRVRIFDQPGDFELPLVERDLRAAHPGRGRASFSRRAGQQVTAASRADSADRFLRLAPRERHVDGTLCPVPFDAECVSPPFYEVVCAHDLILSNCADWQGNRRLRAWIRRAERR